MNHHIWRDQTMPMYANFQGIVWVGNIMTPCWDTTSVLGPSDVVAKNHLSNEKNLVVVVFLGIESYPFMWGF